MTAGEPLADRQYGQTCQNPVRYDLVVVPFADFEWPRYLAVFSQATMEGWLLVVVEFPRQLSALVPLPGLANVSVRPQHGQRFSSEALFSIVSVPTPVVASWGCTMAGSLWLSTYWGRNCRIVEAGGIL